MPQTGIVDATTAAKMFDALRLIPNVDVKPYNDQIAALKLTNDQLTVSLTDASTRADNAVGELRTLSGIVKKYQA